MRLLRRTNWVSRAVCFFLPWRVTSLTLLRLTASSASLIEADKSPWYLRFARSNLSRAISKRTLKTSKPTFLRIATGQDLLQSSFVPRRHLLSSEVENLCVSEPRPSAGRRKDFLGRLNHAGQHVLEQ